MRTLVIAFILFLILESLGIAEASYYLYLNQSGCYSVDDMDDTVDFKETMDSMSVIGESNIYL